MKKLMIATTNGHKVEEFKRMLMPLGYDVLSLLDVDTSIEIEETGSTFEENAIIKATTIHNLLHIPVLSDDSGLAVNAMDGEPGVYSARYMGYETSYEEKNKAIMKIVDASKDKGAQYICVIAYVEQDGSVHTFRGEVQGEIVPKMIGDNGFGYDPIFYYPPFKTTLANVSEEEKNKVSHRARALAKLLTYMEDK